MKTFFNYQNIFALLCSEGVKWYIRKTPAQLSKEQIAAFKAVYDHNNRPVQALNKRTLFIDKTPQITVR